MTIGNLLHSDLARESNDRPGRLHFFWPLPDPPLRVPDGWTCRRTLAPDSTMLQESRIESDLSAIESATFIAQARYLRQPAGEPVPLMRTVAAISRTLLGFDTPIEDSSFTIPRWAEFGSARFGSAREASQASQDEIDPPASDAATPEAMWATVAHLVAATSSDPSADEVSAAFNECLDLVHTTHRGLHHVSGEPIQLPTPEAAPLGVAVALQVLTDQGLENRWPPGLFMLNQNFLPAVEEMTSEELVYLEHAEVKNAAHRPTSLVLDLRREALAAAYLTGDTRTAVVMAATTCETFIDVTLAALLWEEVLTPEQGAAELERYRDTAERLWRLLAPRLGGSWDVTVQPALRGWRELIAMNRNRVVHAGGLPGKGLASAACDAMFPFIGYIMDRLCEPVNRAKYPISALLIAARPCLEARGGWTRRIRLAADEADDLDLQGVFGRWYSTVSELRLPPDVRQKPTRGTIELVVTEGGNTYWIEHDRETSLARIVQPVTDIAQHLQSAQAQPHARGGTYSFSHSPDCSPVGDWVPDYRLVPGVALMRNPENWYEPPEAPPPSEPGVL